MNFYKILLICAVGWLFWDRYGIDSTNQPSPENSSVTPLPSAPLIPPVIFRHEQPNWLVQKILEIDSEYKQGLQILKACKVDDIRWQAVAQIESHNANRPLNLGQVLDQWDAARPWAYVEDPAGRDYFATPLESHDLLRGDCDDYTIYLASCIEAIGGCSVVILGTQPSGTRHAYPAVCLGKLPLNEVYKYIHERYNLTDYDGINIWHDADRNLYLSLDRGSYPGATAFEGTTDIRLYLTDNFIEK